MTRWPEGLQATDPAATRRSCLARDDSASATVHTALMIPLLFGFLGLGVEVSLWYAAKRGAQSIADAAAVAGALELAREGGVAAALAAAREDAALNGYDPHAGDVLTVNVPPTSGAAMAVEAIVRRTPPAPFARFFLDEPVTVAARAVAEAGRPESCLWLLEASDTALELVGTADAELGCGVYVNSTSSSAIDLEGGACLTATSVVVAGGTSGGCIAPEPRTSAPQLGDPLAHLEPPAVAACDYPNRQTVHAGEVRLFPGNRVYCGGIQINGGGSAVFGPGLHVLAGGTFQATGGSTLIGSGVTFYLTDGTGGFAELRLNATAMRLSAPTDGELRGVLFFQDRGAPQTTTHRIAGNADLGLEGTLYFPTGELQFAGGGLIAEASTMIVARKLRFVGNARLDASGSLDAFAPGLSSADLVE